MLTGNDAAFVAKAKFFDKVKMFLNATTAGKVIGWIFACLFIPFICVFSEMITRNSMKQFFAYLFKYFPRFLFALIFVGLIFFALFFLTKRLWIAGLVSGTFFYIASAVQYFKSTIIGDNFYPWDLFFVGEMGGFMDFLPKIRPKFYMVFFLAVLILYIFILSLLHYGDKISYKFSIAIFAIFAVALYLFIFGKNIRLRVYPKFGIHVDHMNYQNANYDQNGFIAAFFLNTGGLKLIAPEDYSEASIKTELAKYQEEPWKNRERPDIIVILSESLWDPENLPGVQISEDPLKNMKKIIEENHGGVMVSNTFGGGTIRPEFEVLTSFSMADMPSGALPYQQYLRGNLFSFAQYYHDMGYRTAGIHTYTSSFYKRGHSYAKLGFDKFIGAEELTDPEYSGPFISDKQLMKEIIKEVETDPKTPSFVFGISMENHGLYSGKYESSDIDIKATGKDFDPEENDILVNYAQGVKNADEAIKELYDYVKQREKPTVVLVFGDHLPSLGSEYKLYHAAGAIKDPDADRWSSNEKKFMFETPFAVFSNYDTGNEFKGDNEEVSPYFLLMLLNDYIGGQKIPYLKFLEDFYNTTTLYNERYDMYDEAANITSAKKFADIHKKITYGALDLGGKVLGK